MRVADLTIGDHVAISPHLQIKHLNLPKPEFGQETTGAMVDMLWTHFAKSALEDWNRHANRTGFHVGQVAELGLWWGGRRGGVLLHVPIPEHLEAIHKSFPGIGPIADVILPSSMLGDIDDELLYRTRKVLYLERLLEARRGGLEPPEWTG